MYDALEGCQTSKQQLFHTRRAHGEDMLMMVRQRLRIRQKASNKIAQQVGLLQDLHVCNSNRQNM